MLVDEHLSGALPLKQYVSHRCAEQSECSPCGAGLLALVCSRVASACVLSLRYTGVGAIKEAIEAMHTGEVLRAVVTY